MHNLPPDLLPRLTQLLLPYMGTQDEVEWLRDAQPEVAAQCITRSGTSMPPDSTLEKLRAAWLPRLTDEQSDPDPRARAAIGRALGQLTLRGEPLDNRKGVSVFVVGTRLAASEQMTLPDIAWGEPVPPGTYTIGGDEKAYRSLEQQKHTLTYEFRLAQYALTYAQFQTFLDDPDGFADDLWWSDLPEEWRKQEMREQRYQYANHPRENVSWYQAYAFCKWLTAQYREYAPDYLPQGWELRLPTQLEWEIAARYDDRRFYPWGNDFDPLKANTSEGKNIGQTSAVGLYPSGMQPKLKLYDLSGNVLEWTLDLYDKPGHIDVLSDSARGLRGGALFVNAHSVRSASRDSYGPYNVDNDIGVRLCAAPVGSAL